MSRIGVSLNRPARTRVLLVALMVGLSSGLLAYVLQGKELQAPGAAERRVALSVATLLERIHLARRPLDGELGRRALDNYLKMLDPMKLHFLRSDIDEFKREGENLDELLKQGDVKLAHTIFHRFLTRLDERTEMIQSLLDGEFDFTVDEEMITDRKALDYPQDADEARSRWQKRIKYDLLVQKADKMAMEEATQKLRRRYQSFAKRMHQTDGDELLEMYLTAVSTAYDPHTTYMSASTLENFEIQMRLELDGIGASLQSEDGYTIVHKIIPGGAADKDGRLKISDQIVSVGQENGDMVDVVDMKLNDVVKLIRGKRGTVVRLGVITADKKQPRTYDITRDRIELKDSEARSEIITEGRKGDGTPFRVGVIDLPSFYMDMSGARQGKADFKSTTRDVRRILEEFKSKDVDAVLIDLRRNGGGSLTEAVNLTGLFINSGPVVQVKGFDGSIEPYEDRDDEIVWGGPLVVLTSKFSASASEIFAGAIQDYRRGLVVGDQATHGKGTVQQLLDLGNQIFRVPNAPKLGALKITIQQFYRPCGDSTQSRGVLSDIELPSITTHLDIGEGDLDYALAFDQVPALEFKDYGMVDGNIINIIKTRSQERVKSCEDFQKTLKNISRYKEQKARKTVMLAEEKFLAERESGSADSAEEEEIEQLNDPNRPVVDRNYYFNEALSVTVDYLDLLRKNKVAKGK